MIEYLEPGKDVKFATPSANGDYADYMRMQLHAVAAGVGLTYELLTGDLSQVNYSSIRAGLIEFRRRMEALQWQLIVPGLCQPVWSRFVNWRRPRANCRKARSRRNGRRRASRRSIP